MAKQVVRSREGFSNSRWSSHALLMIKRFIIDESLFRSNDVLMKTNNDNKIESKQFADDFRYLSFFLMSLFVVQSVRDFSLRDQVEEKQR